MCCLFGLLDYQRNFSSKEKNYIIAILSKECEARGTDATGIAYNSNGRLNIFKRPLPAHKIHYNIPQNTSYIMGHTRLTTQGSEKQNFNNHPFAGSINNNRFALAHNGILYNDSSLRKLEALPLTKIKTDSFIAVQLIEKQKTLNFESLKQMAEKVEGSFTFTTIDETNNLFVVRGSNPFCIYNFYDSGFYLYASTEEILQNAIEKAGIKKWKFEKIKISEGDILKIDKFGNLKYKRFNFKEYINYFDCGLFDRLGYFSNHPTYSIYKKKDYFDIYSDETYIEDLKTIANYYGYCSEDIDLLVSEGYCYDEIEEILFSEMY